MNCITNTPYSDEYWTNRHAVKSALAAANKVDILNFDVSSLSMLKEKLPTINLYFHAFGKPTTYNPELLLDHFCLLNLIDELPATEWIQRSLHILEFM